MHNLAINNLSIPGVPKLSTKPSTLFMVRFYINRSFGIVGMAYDLYSLDIIPVKEHITAVKNHTFLWDV